MGHWFIYLSSLQYKCHKCEKSYCSGHWGCWLYSWTLETYMDGGQLRNCYIRTFSWGPGTVVVASSLIKCNVLSLLKKCRARRAVSIRRNERMNEIHLTSLMQIFFFWMYYRVITMPWRTFKYFLASLTLFVNSIMYAHHFLRIFASPAAF